MNIGIADALLALVPECEFVVRGNTYDGIEWMDSRDKPTEAEVTAKITELTNAQPLSELRAERNRRLAETDFFALSDVEMSADMLAYRQALRDITDVYQSLDTVVWPVKP